MCVSVCVCVNPPPSSRVLVSAFRDQRFLRAIIQNTPLPPSKPNQIKYTWKHSHRCVCVCVRQGVAGKGRKRGVEGRVSTQALALIYENKHMQAHSHISYSLSLSYTHTRMCARAHTHIRTHTHTHTHTHIHTHTLIQGWQAKDYGSVVQLSSDVKCEEALDWTFRLIQ